MNHGNDLLQDRQEDNRRKYKSKIRSGEDPCTADKASLNNKEMSATYYEMKRHGHCVKTVV